MNINVEPTAEAIEAMAILLRDKATELERLATRMRGTKDLELASDAVNCITNLLPTLRLDLLVTRPLKSTGTHG